MQSSWRSRAWTGESGILGLAFQPLTSAVDAQNRRFTYRPIMQTIFDSGTVNAKQFSIALSRDDLNASNGGIFTIGGVPDMHAPEVNVSTDWYSSKPLIEQQTGRYIIEPEGFYVNGVVYNPGLNIIIDSGANILQVPFETAKVMNSFWDPKPSKIDTDGYAYIDCNARYTAKFGINIGGRTFYMDPGVDMIYGKDECFSLIRGVDGSAGYYVGDPLLKNVLAVFNWDKELLS